MKIRMILLAMMALLMHGCGELAYKRGAGANDLQAARDSCRSSTHDSATFDLCMKNSGWSVQKLDDLNPVAILTDTKDNRHADELAGNVYQPAATADVATSATASNDTPGGSGSADKPSSTGTTPAARPADPLDTYQIGSWWKRGPGDAGLQPAIDACVATLGEAHKPHPPALDTTRGLLICMRQKGWYGLVSK